MNDKEIQVPEFVRGNNRRYNLEQKAFRERNRADRDTIRETEKIGKRAAAQESRRQEQEKRRQEQEKIVNIREGMKKREKYKVSKEVKKRNQKARKKSKTPRAIKRLLTAGLIGVMIFGGVKQYQEYKEQQNNRPTLEDVLGDNITLDDLGIDEDIENRIGELKKIDIENLSNVELINLPEEINDMQFDIIKSKLSNVLETSEGSIELKQSIPNRVEIYEDGKLDTVFTEQDKVDEILTKIGIKDANQISPEIGSFISDIANIQTISENITTGDINRDEIMKECKKSIENADKFAAEKMVKDGNLIKMVDATELAKSQEKEIDEEERS